MIMLVMLQMLFVKHVNGLIAKIPEATDAEPIPLTVVVAVHNTVATVHAPAPGT